MSVRIVGIVACVVVALLVIVGVINDGGSSDPPSISSRGFAAGNSHESALDRVNAAARSTTSSHAAGSESAAATNRPLAWIPTHVRVLRHEALPCTGPREPINFEIFSAGPSVAGRSVTHFVRRCDTSTPADEAPANYTSYVYGHCKITSSPNGCEPPLEIQTFPACQRSLADYSYEGKPLPYRRLLDRGGAEVVEINFMLDHRIEVYTNSSTIVIFAADRAIAVKALAQLTPQLEGSPPARDASELEANPDEGLAAPVNKAIEGDLPCQS